MVHIYKEILLSHKKEQLWVSSSEMDKPRAYYTEWNKSERGKQLSYKCIQMESRKMVMMNLFEGQQ